MLPRQFRPQGGANHMTLPRRLLAGLIALIGLTFLVDIMLPPPLERAGDLSALVTDRNGRPLRAFPTTTGGWRFEAHLGDIDPVFIEALLRVEDKRFYDHHGTDWLGLSRALFDSAKAGRVVSGGSTLTMQTARLLEPRPRTARSKLIEIWRANQIERRLSKDEILSLYLTLTPYGGNLEGVRAASWSYFGHEANRLSDDEIALLIALPQSPEVRRPDRRPEQARKARDWVATKLERYDVFTETDVAEIATVGVPTRRRDFPMQAWHGTAKALKTGEYGDVQSTLDAALQAEVEAIALRVAKSEGPEVQVAALVVHTPTRAVRAIAGSATRDRPGGWLDLTAQVRSPGSTLKPFIYAMAFDDGAAAPDTRMSDLPTNFSSYRPENFDRMFRGDVRVAEALQHSLNIPAVMMLERVGPERFTARLSGAGATPRIGGRALAEPGLAIALGGVGMTARDLAVLYSALGEGGMAKPLVWRASEEEASYEAAGHRFISAQSADDIIGILKGAPMPAGRMPGRLTKDAPQIAFKTGTSYGYRDAWAAGVSGAHVIIVWVGRADGAPRPGVTGREGALPVLFEIADRVSRHLRDDGEARERLTTSRRPLSQHALRSFDEGGPPEILFPPQNAELWAGEVNGKAPRPFVLAGRGEGDISWYIDGRPAERDPSGASIWLPDQAGFYLVSAVDDAGRSTRTRVRVLTEMLSN